MTEIQSVSDGYRELFGDSEIIVTVLPKSGSDRIYYRIIDSNRSVIGAYNANLEENEAFIGFTNHFISKGLPVPEIFGYIQKKYVYFLRDLGDTNLFTWLQQKHGNSGFDDEAEKMYCKILDQLIQFQIKGIEGLNLDLCYPHKSFDRQSMMWDLNYFKYMFLKLISVPFNEQRLEHDFNIMVDFLLEPGQDYFLYRDFQSANVMIVDGETWFIDYQGGRKGAPQYDVASLLFDAKALIPQQARQKLFEYYLNNFCSVSGENRNKFRGYYTGFSMIRLMQALGAFGFRGLYENKPTFTGSIIPAVELLSQLIYSEQLSVSLPEIFKVIKSIPEVQMYKTLNKKE
jgi:aminoglycoside/choline kinase family phosphotransferase